LVEVCVQHERLIQASHVEIDVQVVAVGVGVAQVVSPQRLEAAVRDAVVEL
jgi:hypothetical protein